MIFQWIVFWRKICSPPSIENVHFHCEVIHKSTDNAASITEAESKTLTDWLNKAFGGAVKVFNDWGEFVKNIIAAMAVTKLTAMINYIGAQWHMMV